MTSRDFCFWFQGFLELRKVPGSAAPQTNGMSAEQVVLVEAHLALVFKHEIDPSAGGPAQQAALNASHHGVGPGADIRPRC